MTIDDLARVLEVFPTPQHIAALRITARLLPCSIDNQETVGIQCLIAGKIITLQFTLEQLDDDEIRRLLTEAAGFLEMFIDEEET